MSGRTGLMLALAIGCGLLAMLGVQQLVGRKSAAQPAVEMLVAARDLQAEESLTPDLVAVKKVPKSDLPAGSVGSYKDVEGRWVKLPILAGEPIVDAKLAPKGEAPGLLGRIPPGFRAFAVEVNEQSGVSGFILPDYHVDVVLARSKDTSTAGSEPRAETILQDILVLAAGTATARTDDKSIEVRTVTLAVTPEQVALLVAARAEGSLSLSLRGQNSHEIVETPAPLPPPAPAPPVVAPEPPPAPAPAVVVAAVEPPRPVRRPVRIWHGPGRAYRGQSNPEVHDPEGEAQAQAEQVARARSAAPPDTAPMVPPTPPAMAGMPSQAPPTWEVPPPWAMPPYGVPPQAAAAALTATTGLGPHP
jgi:pilus assembly protein CpaB